MYIFICIFICINLYMYKSLYLYIDIQNFHFYSVKMVFAKFLLVSLIFRVKTFWGKIANDIKKVK